MNRTARPAARTPRTPDLPAIAARLRDRLVDQHGCSPTVLRVSYAAFSIAWPTADGARTHVLTCERSWWPKRAPWLVECDARGQRICGFPKLAKLAPHIVGGPTESSIFCDGEDVLLNAIRAVDKAVRAEAAR